MLDTRGQFPGEELVEKGLRDLALGISSSYALLVLIGAPRLRRLGVTIPSQKNIPAHPEHALYYYLQGENVDGVHSRYNSLIRRLVSYERALERQ